MTESILSLAVCFGILVVAVLIIGREVAVHWTNIAEALAFREPGYVRKQQARVTVWHSAA